MTKQHYMPLFFGDFLAATAEWDGEEASLYLTLLGHQWSLGSLPADPNKLKNLVRWSADTFNRCWPTVAVKFDERDGRLTNARLEEHRAKAISISEARAANGKAGANKRWQSDSKEMANAIDLLCHPIQSNPREKNKSADAPFDPSSIPGLDAAAWSEWIEYRKGVGKALKPASMRAAAKKMAALGAGQQAAVTNSIANGYQGLFAPNGVFAQPAKKDPYANCEN